MHDFLSKLKRISKMAKSNLFEIPAIHPDFLLPDVLPFDTTILGKYLELNGFTFTLSYLIAHYGIDKKNMVYFIDGFSEYWAAKGIIQTRTKLLLLAMYGFNECFSVKEFYRTYPEIIKKYLYANEPILAFQKDVIAFNKVIIDELSKSDFGSFSPTGVFGLDYSFTVKYGYEGTQAIGRLPLISRGDMSWI